MRTGPGAGLFTLWHASLSSLSFLLLQSGYILTADAELHRQTPCCADPLTTSPPLPNVSFHTRAAHRYTEALLLYERRLAVYIVRAYRDPDRRRIAHVVDHERAGVSSHGPRIHRLCKRH